MSPPRHFSSRPLSPTFGVSHEKVPEVMKVDADPELSATGGSARTQAHDLRSRTWRPRPMLSFTIGAIAFVLPLTAAVAVVQIAAHLVRPPEAVAALILWLLGLVAIAGVTLWTVHRTAKRLLPIAAMLRFSLVFPDSAPSRFAVALRTGSGRALERALQQGTTTSADFSTSRDSASLVVGLIAAVSAHDRMTRGHSERVRAYADLIGEELGLEPEDRNKLHWAALLHDVGKLAVPAAILNKPERLTAEEWDIVRRHPAMSARWLEPVREWLGDWALAASQHHERYDGLGYPDGVQGDDISLAGRIVAVADAFDVMTSTRSYKNPLPAAQARAELTNNAGTQFDPKIVRAFLAISLGKLRLVVGPLAGVSAISGLISVGGVASGAAAAVASTAVAASALTVVPPVSHVAVRTARTTTTIAAIAPAPVLPAVSVFRPRAVHRADVDIPTRAAAAATGGPPSPSNPAPTCAPPLPAGSHPPRTAKSVAPPNGLPAPKPKCTPVRAPAPPPPAPAPKAKHTGPGLKKDKPTPGAKVSKPVPAPKTPKSPKAPTTPKTPKTPNVSSKSAPAPKPKPKVGKP
jgi:HD-GYP domain-containing protein (c-di-GMP phosphodiesterase class II)